MIVLVDTKELCNQLSGDIRALITKELVIFAFHSDISLKKSKKKLERPTDIIVGTINRINELFALGSLKLRTVKHVVIVNYDKIDAKELDNFMSNVLAADADGSVDDRATQVVVTSSSVDKSLEAFMEKHSKGVYEHIAEEDDDSSDDDGDSSDASSSDAEVVKVVKANGDAEEQPAESGSDSDEKEDDSSVEKNGQYEIDEQLMT